MSSLAGKMSLLVDEYNHSKTSPAYRKLSIKYKALKKSNQELIQLLTSLFAGSVNHDNIRRTSRRSQTHADRTHAYQDDILEESQSDEEMEATFVPYDLPQNNTDDIFEEKEGDEECVPSPELRRSVWEAKDEYLRENDLESCHEEEEGEADCEEEEETEDPDIKEQIIQEHVAESFAIKEEEQQTVTVEEEETEEIVEYEEVEETEEVEEVEEVVEYEEVEEVVEYEEVEEEEEEEEEEAGVYEIEVNGTRYYTTNEKDGIVYALLEDDDVGDEVGKFVNGKLVLN